MNKEEFIKYIGSIGFTRINGYDNQYGYKEFIIDLSDNEYSLYNIDNYFLVMRYSDLRLIKYEFKNELRSIKLKQLLR